MAIRAANWKSSTLPMRVSSWKKRKLAFSAARSPAGEKREAAAAAGQQDEGVRRERKPRPQQPRRKEGAEQRNRVLLRPKPRVKSVLLRYRMFPF